MKALVRKALGNNQLHYVSPGENSDSDNPKRDHKPTLRAAVFTMVFALVALKAESRSAIAGPDPCMTVGVVATCQGDQSAGITSEGGAPDFAVTAITTLNVNNLIQDIIPAAGVAGIEFRSSGDITINSNTGTHAIITNGFDADGVFVLKTTNPGDINITATGNITTTGNNSSGVSVEHQADGDVSVTTVGNIATSGTFTAGVNALSRGAGDVTVASTGDIIVGGYSNSGIEVANLTADAVYVYNTGDILATGDSSRGIIIINGGGTNTVVQSGDITTPGMNSDAIRVDNFPGLVQSIVDITAGSTITGGTESGDGVEISGGQSSTINNFGTIRALSGSAIRAGIADETINNSGTVIGNVDLGSGMNAFNNDNGGLFVTGAVVNLGVGNTLTNAGRLSPGGIGRTQTTMVTGNLVQTPTGIYSPDIDLTAQTGDLLVVTGTANLSGMVVPEIVNPAVGEQQTTIVTAAGGTTNGGLGLSVGALYASPVLNAELLFPNATDVVLSTNLDFAVDGLNNNQKAIGESLNQIVGTGALQSIFDALLNGVFTLNDYVAALDSLSAELYLNTQASMLYGGEEFTSNLLSCKVPGSGEAFIREGQCVWLRPEGRFYNRDRTHDAIGFEEDVGGLSAGLQVRLAPGWSAGIGLDYEYAKLSTDTVAESDSQRYSAGGALKFQSGPASIGAVISGGFGQFDAQRILNFGGFIGAATSDYDVAYVSSRVRAAYLFSHRQWYLKPLVDLTLSYIDRDGFTESGAGDANLTVAGESDTFFSVRPALELGGEFVTNVNTRIKPYVRAGVSFYEQNDHSITARFSGAPTTIGGFTLDLELDDVFADIETGVTLLKDNGTSLSIGYEGRLSDNSGQHGLFGKGTMRF